MRKSDGQIKKTLVYCKKPLIAANWTIEPVSEDKADQEIAEFIEWNLMEGMTKTWRYILNHFLLALDMGVMVFEKVWEYDRDTGRVYCSKLAPRMPKTIFKWNEDKNSNLESIEQMVSTKKTEPMPGDKIIHFAIDQEFDNWEGESIMRPAYRHWKMKLAFEKISAMSYERFGMGVPIFTEPENATDEDRERADAIGKNLRAHESASVRVPFGWELEFKFGENWKPADGQIRYHNEMISASMLQQFTDLGTMDRGSRAVGEVLEDPFYISLEAIGEQICETLNKQFIPELIGYNWAGVKELPKLKCSNIRVEDYTAISDALQKIGPFITPDFYIEQHLRQIMKLPEMQEEEQRQKMPETEPTGEPVKASESGGNPLVFAGKRAPKDFERHVDFSGIASRIDTAADALTDVLGKVRKEQAKALAKDLAVMAKTGRIDPNKVKIGLFGKATAAVKTAMKDAHKFGADKAAEELKKQKAAEVLDKRQQGERVMKEAPKKPGKPIKRKSPPFDEVMENRADMIVATSNEQLKAAALRKAIPLLKQTELPSIEAILYDHLLDVSIQGLRMFCSGAITESINEGRADYVAEMAQEYATSIRSAMMDNNVCDECDSADGEEFSVEDGIEVTLPDPACAGGDLCRCIVVYIGKDEEKAIV